MKMVFATSALAEVEGMQRVLQREGVSSVLLNTGASDDYAGSSFGAELWVTQDRHYPQALTLYESCLRPTLAGRSHWLCAKCGTEVSSVFDGCWECGTPRAKVAT
jgi:hypothetical protein